jgi:hypothetical protein
MNNIGWTCEPTSYHCYSATAPFEWITVTDLTMGSCNKNNPIIQDHIACYGTTTEQAINVPTSTVNVTVDTYTLMIGLQVILFVLSMFFAFIFFKWKD